MGSDSDLPTMKAAADILDSFGIPVQVTVVSAHRTPERMLEYAKTAHTRGIRVIIAGAGESHVPKYTKNLTPTRRRCCTSAWNGRIFDTLACHRRSMCSIGKSPGWTGRIDVHRADAKRSPSRDCRNWKCCQRRTASRTHASYD